MKRITTLLACGITSAVLTQNASAQVLVNDNFDSYADQAAFLTAWPVVSPQPSGILVSTQSVSFANSVNNVATALAADAQRNQRSFTESGLPSAISSITFSFDFYDSNAAASPYRQFSNLQDGTAPASFGQLVAMGLNNNQASTANGGNFYMARILGFTPSDTGGSSGSFFKLNEAGAPLRTTGWHNLAVTINDVDFRFFVDGILSETVAQTGALSLRSYDVVRLGSGLSNAGNEAFYDNVRVEVIPVPEPSAMALGLLGGVGLMFGLSRWRAR
jgi:hypothetical protein